MSDFKTKNCSQCAFSFAITAEDSIWYNKFDVCDPKLCPRCRAQRRLAFRNERSFYKRPCDKCKRDVVSMYSPNKPYAVWCHDCWFADDWDPKDFGKDYNPSQPFFEQVENIWRQVPKVALIHVRSVNCEYLNVCADNKNCYMIVESSNNEDSIHCYWIQKTRGCVDTSFSHECERCYESDDIYNCYQVRYSKGCHDCRDAYFLFDCRNCSDCIGCVNLRNKRYCIFNKQVTKEEYRKFLDEARLDTHTGVEKIQTQFEKFKATQPHKYAEAVNTVNCTGNYLKDAKNCIDCFHTYEAEDCKYALHAWRDAKDCVDTDTTGRGVQMVYNSHNTGINASNCICCAQCWGSMLLEYCSHCHDSQNCFGSTGLRKAKYCILNKQYSEEEYKKLKAQIVERMKRDEIYGEFFPPSSSAFGYNEACVQEQFPLTKENALAQGFKWEYHPRGTYGKETVDWGEISDSIRDFTTEDINKDIFACTACKKNYRIIPDELALYRKLEIPLPRVCPDCRHARRFVARGPNRLRTESCKCTVAHHAHGDAGCSITFKTAYPKEWNFLLYCEACYNAEVA
ncbi:MAG: hypothetical protein NUV53_03705 [Patescibacteria group bacterium]|nr:hypothetical protein [Patescibacteria group bacterium]